MKIFCLFVYFFPSHISCVEEMIFLCSEVKRYFNCRLYFSGSHDGDEWGRRQRREQWPQRFPGEGELDHWTHQLQVREPDYSVPVLDSPAPSRGVGPLDSYQLQEGELGPWTHQQGFVSGPILERIQFLLSKIRVWYQYLPTNFIIFKFMMPHTFFFSQINELI